MTPPSNLRRKAVWSLPLMAATIVLLASLARRGHPRSAGRNEAGGVAMGHAGAYELLSRLAFGSLFGPIAADVARAVPSDGRVLEVGCGPGHLSIRLTRDYGLDVTSIDLDPGMIQRAQRNADREPSARTRPAFMTADVASLPFSDASFDLVISTFSMHHWADPIIGLEEIDRVLRPDGRALIWDFRPGVRLFHAPMPDHVLLAERSPLRVVSATPLRWPWRLTLAQRMEFLPAGRSSAE